MTQSVAVIGLGYIGLPTAAILASHGYKVLGVDVNDKHVDAVNRGEVPFVEPDLGAYVASAVRKDLLSAQKDTPKADVYIIAVPTPFAEGYKADLSYIDAATEISPISSPAPPNSPPSAIQPSAIGVPSRAISAIRDHSARHHLPSRR